MRCETNRPSGPMGQNTIVCAFDQRNPRITAYNIHEWIHEKLRLEEDEISMIQIDGLRRRVLSNSKMAYV